MNDKELIKLIEQAAKDGVTELNLSDKGITELPAQIGQLTSLNTLDLRYNSLPIPTEILERTNEPATILDYYLYGDPKVLQIVEEAIKKRVTRLEIFHQNIAQLPSKIGELTNLTTLDLRYNALSSLPAEIGQLTNLTTLSLWGNRLSSLPAEIGQLSNLTTLFLSENRLSICPSWIGQLSNLTTLSFWGNQLSSLPAEIGQLPNLTTLDLSRNKLSSLPAEIGQLTHLTTLDLEQNQLSSLPPEIAQLTNLKQLHLRGNRLPIPPEIFERTGEPATILDYYFRGRKKPLNEGKLVLVGEGRVGKTSLVKRLVEKQFNPNERITEGIAIKEWKVRVDEAEIKLNIWDFGGQEIMHATHQFFLTLRTLYVLVLDAQQDEASNRLDYWLKLIESFGADSPIIVVSNQIDQARKLYLNQGELKRKYPQIKAFMNTSCKTGQGLADLERGITRLIGSLAHVHDEIPLEWLAVKSQLQGLGKDYVAYDDYVRLCQANHVRKKREQRTLIRLLHDLGVVLNFQDDPRLRETSVLNPAWVTGGVYKIINAKQIRENKGFLEIRQLDYILDHVRYPKEKHLFILDMMRKFELCFDLEGHTDEAFLIPDLFEEKILIPDVLPKEESQLDWLGDSLTFEYHYEFLPRSIISRLMVRMHGFIFQESYWVNAVVLVYNENKALVKAFLKKKKMVISLRGDPRKKREFWAIIHNQLEDIHSSIKGLNVQVKIRYQGELIDYTFLRKLKQQDILETHLSIGEKIVKVNVRQLLEGEGARAALKAAEPKKIIGLRNALEPLRLRVHPQKYYSVALSLGRLYYEEVGEYTFARQALVEGHEAIEALRGMVQEEIQLRLSAQSVRLYGMLVRCCLVERDEKKAFEYAAAAKGRAFVNRLAEARLDLQSLAAEQPDFARKLALVRQKRRQIDQLERLIGGKRANRDKLLGRQSVLLREEAELWREMGREYPALTATLTVPSLSAKQARTLAKELDATLVEYYRHASGWCAFVVTSDGIRHVRLPGLDDKLLKRLADWRNHVHLRSGRTPRRNRRLQRLYEAVVAPLRLKKPESNSRRVILAPFRELHLLPLAAAYDGARYLAEDYVISYTPSLTALYVVSQEQKRRRSSQGFERLLSVVYPGVPASADYLPNVLEEAEAIAARLSGVAQVDTLREQEATPDEVLKRAPGYDVIHFGCHGRFDSQNPEESGLMLAQKPLTVAQIITQLNLKRTRLTTLAACLTGEVALREGEEHVGLLQAMMTAGVQTVVASLWPVDDAATRALFEAFYTRQATLNAPAEAMQDACELLRHQQAWQHPYYWAAFAVNGLVPPRQERINDTIWPPTDLSEQIEQYTREHTRERNQMIAYQPMPEAELLLGDLLDERQEVLQALKQHPLSKAAAAQRIPTGELGVAYALHLLVQDNPALQEFIGQEMANLNAWSDFIELVEKGKVRRTVGPKEHEKGQNLTTESVKATQMDNSISDFRDHFMSVLEQEPPPEEEKKGLIERVLGRFFREIG